MSDPPHYPPGTVRALLQTDHVSDATRRALLSRMHASEQPWSARFFTDGEVATVRAVAIRLTGGDDLSETVAVARTIDVRLADGETDGWRPADFPDDRDAWRLALRGFDEVARERFGAPFTALPGDRQDQVLRAVQAGDVSTPSWQRLPPAAFFPEMLAEVCEIFFGHPLVQEEFGYVGMADLPSWQAIGLGRLDAREPRPVRSSDVVTD